VSTRGVDDSVAFDLASVGLDGCYMSALGAQLNVLHPRVGDKLGPIQLSGGDANEEGRMGLRKMSIRFKVTN